jgi:hypothetical protein
MPTLRIFAILLSPLAPTKQTQGQYYKLGHARPLPQSSQNTVH